MNITKTIKVSKTIMYSAMAAPFVTRVLNAVGVEIDPDVRFCIDIFSPVVSAAAGMTYKKATQLAAVAKIAKNPATFGTLDFQSGHGKNRVDVSAIIVNRDVLINDDSAKEFRAYLAEKALA